MSRQFLILANDQVRERACKLIMEAPDKARVEIKGPVRSLDQNRRLWAMLTDVAEQTNWHGVKLATEDWKDLFTASLRRELRPVPNLDGDGFVLLGLHTSDMTVPEMGDLMTLIEAFGAARGVVFHDQQREEAA